MFNPVGVLERRFKPLRWWMPPDFGAVPGGLRVYVYAFEEMAETLVAQRLGLQCIDVGIDSGFAAQLF